jgi:hypothetical protein
MGNALLAYIVALGLIGVGVGWIIAGQHSALFIGIGTASIAVGALSVLNELHNHRGWR